MNYWDHGELSVSGNKKYLQNGEVPFFWMGDTAWLFTQTCSLEECALYLRNRKEKGFNVIQIDFFHSYKEDRKEGDEGWDKDIRNPEYWELCDRVIDMAEDMGLYMAVLPVWGSIAKSEIMDEEKMVRYGRFLGARYQEKKNLIWVIGGDVRGDAAYPRFCALGRTLKEYNPSRLMSFHPFGRTSSDQWFAEEPWMDFHMFQSGHRRYDQVTLGRWDDKGQGDNTYGEDNWRYVDQVHSRADVKPVVDAEPSYEGIPHGLHDPREPYWEDCDVRRYGYWSVFQGACGYTYGHNAIMQFHSDISKPGAFGVREHWMDALHQEGSCQMRHLRSLMERVDFVHGTPREELLLCGQKERYHRISVFAGKNYIYCYDYMGDMFILDLKDYKDKKKLSGYWFEPVSGTFSYMGDLTGMKEITVRPPRKASGQNDWVFAVFSEDGSCFPC